MAIEAELHDGTVLEFPDGTDPTVVQSTVKRVLAEKYPPTLGGYAKETLKALPRGAMGFLETAATGAAALLPEDYEKAVVEKAHKYAQKFSPTVAPGYEEAVPVKLAEGIGSMLAPIVVPGGIVSKGLTFGAAGAGEARQRAQQAGATPEQISEATAQGIIPGLTDLLPFHYLMGSLGKTAVTGLLSRAVRMTVTGGLEGATEGAQRIMQNAIAQGYDPKQDTYEGATEEAAYGAGVGAIAQGLMDAVFGRRASKAARQAPTEPPAISPQTVATQADEIGKAAEETPAAIPTPQLTETTEPKEEVAPTVAPALKTKPAPEAAPEIVSKTVPEAKRRAVEEAPSTTTSLNFPVRSVTTGNEYIDRAQDLVDIYGRGEHGLYYSHNFVSKVKNSIRELNGKDFRRRPGMTESNYYARLIDNLKQAIADAKTELTPEAQSGVQQPTESTTAGAVGQPPAGESVSKPVSPPPSVGEGTPDVGGAGVGTAVEPAAGVAEGEAGQPSALSKEEESAVQDELSAETTALGEATPQKARVKKEKVEAEEEEEEKETPTYKSQEEARQFSALAQQTRTLNSTKDAKQYAAALDNIVETAEEHLTKGVSLAGTKRAAQQVLETIPETDITAARERLQKKAQKLKGSAKLRSIDKELLGINSALDQLTEEYGVALEKNDDVALTKISKAITKQKGKRQDLLEERRRYSLSDETEPTGNTKEALDKALATELRPNSELARITKTVQSESELPPELQKPGTRGVTANGKIWLVADNIASGDELGVFLHEAGAHIGFDRVLSDKQRQQLADTVRGWGRGNDLKGKAAKVAMSKGGKNNDEVIAYAVEELVNRGIKPTAFSAESNWLKRIISAFRDALKKFGLLKDFTPQNLVDMAYGAAHIDTEVGEVTQTPRYSAATAAIADASATVDKLFSGPSAPKGIVARTIEGMAGPDKLKKVGGASLSLRTKLADKAAPWKDFLQDVHQGKVLDEMGMANAVERIEAATKTSGIQLSVMEMGGLRIDPKTGMWHAYQTDASYKDIIETLNKAVGKYEGMDTFSDVEKFFNLTGIARRENELKKNKQLGGEEGQIRPTLNNKQIEQGLALYETIPEFRQALDTFEKLNNRLVDSMVDAGVFDKEYAEQLKGTTGYVPWFRFSTDKDNNIKVLNPKAFTRGLILLSNMKDLKGAPIEDVQINNLLDNMARLNNWMVSKAIGNHTAVYMGELGKSLGIAERVGSMEGGEKGQVIKVYKGGKEAFYAFNDPAFIPAFKGNEIALGSLVKMLSVPANITRRAITVFNPVFSLTQLPQDAMRAFVEGGLKNPWAIYPKVLGNFLKEMINPTESAIRLREYGIKGRASDIVPGEAGRSFRRKLGYYDSSLRGYGAQGYDFLERFQNASDAAVRSALYELTMKETGNEVLALKRAREIINFDTQGSSDIATFLRSTVPFMGVQMISLNNLYRGLVLGQRMTEGDKAATRRAIYASGMQLAAMTMLYTMLVADDDDYKKRSDEERAHSFIIPGTNLRIPAPSDGIGFLFKVLPEQVTRYVVSEGVGSEDMGGRTMRGIGVGLLGVADWVGFVPMLGNPLIKTFIEAKLNRSFFTGDPIIGKGQEGKEPFAQQVEGTSELAKLVGLVSKDAASILPPQFQADAQISPIKFDYLVRAMTSQVGGFGLMTLNSLFHAAEGKVTPSMKWEDFPLLKRLTYSDKDRADLEDFYEMRDRVDMISRTYRDFITSGRGKEAADYMSDPENRRAFALRKYETQIEQQLTKFRQARKLVINDPKIKDSDEMEARLDALNAQQEKFLKSTQLSKARAMAGM